MSEFRVVLLPGAVLPAHLAYEGLVTALEPDADVIVKELELYRAGSPPSGYSLDTEVAGVLRAADERGWDGFHLVGYSAGAAVALACAAKAPTRLMSLALLEPAWAGRWDWSREHEQLWAEYGELARSDPERIMPAFMRLQVRPEVELPTPPPGPPPPWMAQRPAGVLALLETFQTYGLDRSTLAGFGRPVYYALGGLSNPVQFAEIAERLDDVFPDFTLEVFQERHHFDPPHRREPERLAQSLRAIWSRADRSRSRA